MGDELLRVVREYDAIDGHRTGTDGDRATCAWLRSRLEEIGGRTSELRYAFERFDAREHHVELDGVEVPSLPLWYAGAGRYDTTDMTRSSGAVTHAPWQDAAGPSVVATTDAGALLVAPNRPPTSSLAAPVALISGEHAAALQHAPVRYRSELVRDVGRSATVAARFGPADRPPVIVTTPLTGWFSCAGERATGIAIALALAERLATERPVLFLGTTGHEIGYLGVRDIVDAGVCDGAAAIIHIGASVGAGHEVPDGAAPRLTFGPDRWVFATVPDEGAAALREAVTVGAYEKVLVDPPDWYGEGEVLKAVGVPLLSFLGTFPLFHTPQDVPDRATNAALMTDAMTAVSGGVDALLTHTAATG